MNDLLDFNFPFAEDEEAGQDHQKALCTIHWTMDITMTWQDHLTNLGHC